MNKTLTVMRHAKSSWGTGDADITRPLARRGKKDATAAARWLTAEGYAFDLVYCSPATRTRQTWAALESGGVQAGSVDYVEGIYEGYTESLFDIVRAAPEDATSLLLIGHMPTVEMFCLVATGSELLSRDGQQMEFRTGALAVLQLDVPWAALAPGAARFVRGRTPRA